jgi:hypothetical protein
MLSDTNTEHLLQLDIKEEPRLSPNDKVSGESRLQEKHKRRARLHKDYNKNLILKMKIMRQYLTTLTPVQFATKNTNGKNI